MLKTKNEIKSEFCKIGKLLYKRGFVPGTAGNISCRCGENFLVSASGCCLGNLSDKDIILIDPDGMPFENSANPSSERFMHIEIYRKRSDINCILHAHPPKSTALSIAGKDLKSPILAEAVIGLGEVPLVEYETPSTLKLAQDVAENFVNHDAVLMANHGVAVCGNSLEQTFFRMETLEFLSEVFIITESLGVKNEIPSEKLVDLLKIREKFKNAIH